MTDYIYDNLGRMTEERWKSGSSTVRTLSFEYDLAGQMKAADDTDANSRDYDYVYDELGRTKEIDWQVGSTSLKLKSFFDDLSRRNKRQLDATIGGTTYDVMTDEYLYDRLSRMTQAKQYDAGSLVTDKRADFTYNAAGQLDTIQRYNHLTSSGSSYLITTSEYDYDGAARLSALSHTRNSTILAGYNYTWDAADRITNMDFSPSTYDAEDAVFNYDSTSQLIGAERYGTANDETYLYDDNGNRDTVSRDGTANQDWQIGTNNRLTDDGTFTYTYDNEGNRLTKVRKDSATVNDKTVAYTWDYRNRLSTVTFKRNDGTVTKTVDYSYDMFNRWTKRVLDSDGALGSTALIVDDYMHDAEEKIVHTSSQMVGRSHVYLHGPLQDQVLFDEVAAGLRITLADHLNTVRDVYDTSGNLLNHVTYDSFGRRTAETNTAIEVFYGFTGRPYDEDTGLGNHLNRWYDSNGGKWISEDPIGFEGGDSNLNRYVGNRSVVYIDPNGLLDFMPGSTSTYDELLDAHPRHHSSPVSTPAPRAVRRPLNGNGGPNTNPKGHQVKSGITDEVKHGDVVLRRNPKNAGIPIDFFIPPHGLWGDRTKTLKQGNASTIQLADKAYKSKYCAEIYFAGINKYVGLPSTAMDFRDLIGTHGTGPCIGLIAIDDHNSKIFAFHFNAMSDPAATINKLGLQFQTTRYYMFGGENLGSSYGLVNEILNEISVHGSTHRVTWFNTRASGLYVNKYGDPFIFKKADQTSDE